MPEFNTVEFNALPHHSPRAALVKSDCCHLYARTGRNRAAHRFTFGAVVSSSRLTLGEYRSAPRGYQEPMGRVGASQLGGTRIKSAAGEYRRIVRPAIRRANGMGFAISLNSLSRMHCELLRKSGGSLSSARGTPSYPSPHGRSERVRRLASVSTARCGIRCPRRFASASKIRALSFTPGRRQAEEVRVRPGDGASVYAYQYGGLAKAAVLGCD